VTLGKFRLERVLPSSVAYSKLAESITSTKPVVAGIRPPEVPPYPYAIPVNPFLKKYLKGKHNLPPPLVSNEIN